MASFKKFLFEESFDAAQAAALDTEPEPELPPEPSPPTFGEAELEAARAEGFTAGQAKGQEQALDGIEKVGADAVALVSAQLESLLALETEMRSTQARVATETGIQIVRKLFPRLAQLSAMAEVEKVIADCLGHLREEPRVVVRIAADLVEPLSLRLSELATATDFEGKLVLISDESLEASSVRVEWAAGGAERDTARIWREIEEVIACRFGPAQAETTTPETQSEEQAGVAAGGDEAQATETLSAAQTA